MNKFVAAFAVVGLLGGGALFSSFYAGGHAPAQVAGIKIADNTEMASSSEDMPVMPPECAPLSSGKQERCEEAHKKTQDCLNKTAASGRVACAMQELGLGKAASTAIKACGSQEGIDKAVCETATKEKVAALVQFRISDLIARAQALPSQKINQNSLATLVSTLEKAQTDFSNASTMAQRRQILNNVRAAWKKFATPLKNKALLTDNLTQAFTDIKSL